MNLVIAHISDVHFGARVDLPQVGVLEGFLPTLRPAVIVVSGDITLRARHGEFQAALRFMDSIGRIAPTHLVPGNHDLYQADGWESFKLRFGPSTYAVTVGGRVKLILLDTAVGELGATQFDWLEKELAGPGVRLVGTHYALFDGANPMLWRMPSSAERLKLIALMRDRGVPMLVSGHLHGFRHAIIGATEHFIVGTMGAGELDYGEPGFLLVTWARETLTWQFVTAPE